MSSFCVAHNGSGKGQAARQQTGLEAEGRVGDQKQKAEQEFGQGAQTRKQKAEHLIVQRKGIGVVLKPRLGPE